MPKFKYRALAADGSTVSGSLEAMSAGLVNTALLERDLDPVHVEEKTSILQLEITKKKVPRKELMHFSRQMAAFIRAGIPILEALDVIAEETGNKVFQKALYEMVDALRGGATFADAAESQPQAFPVFYLSILRSAELTGNLDVVLEQLSEYIERDLEAKRRITSALVYPSLVIAMAIVTVIILTSWVLPRFERFFESFDAELPLVTRMLLSVTEFISNFWYLFAAFGIALVAAPIIAMKTTRGRALRDRLFLAMPVAGEVVQFAVLERFCRILSSMVRSGVPLPEALRVSADASNNAVYQRELAVAREAMVRGEGLAAPLAATNLFPSAARQIFRVGEETGTLDDQLETAAKYFDRELSYKITRFTNFFEPAVILFVGLVVGFVAIALVSAMYGIFDQVEI